MPKIDSRTRAMVCAGTGQASKANHEPKRTWTTCPNCRMWSGWSNRLPAHIEACKK